MPNLLIFTIRRLLAGLFIVFLVTTFVFVLAHFSPVDPVRLILAQHTGAEPAVAARLRHEFGLDMPLHQQYLQYMGNLLHGNLGYSENPDQLGTPVWPIIQQGVPVSVKLGSLSLLLALLVGLPVGLLSALRQNTWIDHSSQAVMMVVYAVPVFVVVPLMQLLIAVKLGWLPVAGWGDPGVQGYKELIMPVTLFAAGIAGFFAKSFRSFLLEILQQDYIRTARAKGLKERLVIYLHAIKNTLLPLATIVGPTIAFLVVGAFIIENYFSIPGIGQITVQSVVTSDYPVVEATTILIATSVVVINFLTDVFYAMVDPRVRL